MTRPAPESRVESLIAWFAASVLTAAAVIYAMKRDDRPRKAEVAFGSANPATEPLSLQEARAREHGRGRKAPTPVHIPWRGWKDIFIRTYHEVQDDRLLSLAAGVVFYSLVALFPAIAAGVSVYAFFSDAASITNHLSLVADIVPGASLDLLRDEITRIAGRSDGRLTFGFLVGFRHRAVERQCRHEGDLRRAQHHLRRRGKARLHLAERGVAVRSRSAPSAAR